MIRPLLLAAMLAATAAHASEDELISAEEGWRPHVQQVVTDNWVRGGETNDPLTAPMTVCQGTACAQTSEVRLSDAEAEEIRAIFAAGSADAEAERAAIAQAVARFETHVGAKNGTWRDHARNTHESDDEDGQMDCVSEAANTRAYLHRLLQARLLTRHRVGGFVTRYLVLLQHVAVEMTETDSAARWVIDSWDGDNGAPPLIAPYGVWRMEFLA